ncbi:hypothetical protein LXL04_003456 [Taraxacum kok-saghyz]
MGLNFKDLVKNSTPLLYENVLTNNRNNGPNKDCSGGEEETTSKRRRKRVRGSGNHDWQMMNRSQSFPDFMKDLGAGETGNWGDGEEKQGRKGVELESKLNRKERIEGLWFVHNNFKAGSTL